MSKVLDSPAARLVARAVLAGIAVFAATLQAGGVVSWSAVGAAATSALWAAVEYFTPLNALIGRGKSN